MIHARTVPRYLVVGGLSAVLSNIILIAFDYLGIHYTVSCIVAFVVTLLLAYEMHTLWTFDADRSLGGFLRYGAAMAFNLPLSISLFFGLVSVAGVPMVVAAPTATILMTVLNYVIAAVLIGSRPRSR